MFNEELLTSFRIKNILPKFGTYYMKPLQMKTSLQNSNCSRDSHSTAVYLFYNLTECLTTSSATFLVRLKMTPKKGLKPKISLG